ncbi:MAG: (d)CMP kinase [Nitrospirae bacterium]|jgi:CMP/dCMP kinase|nr:(d)CMP kinase [Nitrospirota bacterium]
MGKVIAIDGPSGSGKTTIAKLLAKELGFGYLDTGALYRAIAIALREKKVAPEDNDDKIKRVFDNTVIGFNNGKVFLNGRDVSEEIRTTEIDHYSSVFSAKRIVRDFLLDLQRNAALNNDLVIEGRDTTTVVFPHAQKKIFLYASDEERARRRYFQFKEKGIDITMDEARKNILERDKRDANRDIAPLKAAPEAFLVDSSNLSVEQVFKKILDFLRTDP